MFGCLAVCLVCGLGVEQWWDERSRCIEQCASEFLWSSGSDPIKEWLCQESSARLRMNVVKGPITAVFRFKRCLRGSGTLKNNDTGLGSRSDWPIRLAFTNEELA